MKEQGQDRKEQEEESEVDDTGVLTLIQSPGPKIIPPDIIRYDKAILQYIEIVRLFFRV